jgi:hypothetical protein
MVRKVLVAGLLIASVLRIAVAAAPTTDQTKLTASQIVERNVAARGGLTAWRGVQSLQETGTLGAGGNDRSAQQVEIPGAKWPGKAMPLPSSPRLKEEAQLPFVMDFERPRKMRVELQFAGKTAIQVYDGENGWKLRLYLNRLEAAPYTEDKQKLAAMRSELDGPLVDYVAKGTTIERVGVEKVEGRDTYNPWLTLKAGRVDHVWVDAQTFLETKIDGQPRRLDGKIHPVEVYYQDYRTVNGLQMLLLLETHVLPSEPSPAAAREPHYPAEKINLEKILVNPKLDASAFTKPHVDVAVSHP